MAISQEVHILGEVTPLILTFNEAPNIRRTLENLSWAREILVVDSFSTDETLEIVRSFPRARVFLRTFDNHTAQWNYGLEQVASEWVLSLDADYVVNADFIAELERINLSSSDLSAWFARIRYCISGHELRGSLYPPRAVLFRKSRCRYVDDGHTQLLDIDGLTGMLKAPVLHDDRKPLSRWLNSQPRYLSLEADKLLKTPHDQLGWKDRLRKRIVFAPLLTVLYCLFAKQLIFDGWPGIFYTSQRVYAELLLSLELLDRRLKRRDPP